jgi:glycosyl-4,4'-diaponeurosporenoate acyltransferase
MPPQGVLVNLVFATLFNLPCLWVQRYNRLRLRKILGEEQQPAARPLRPLAGPSTRAPG